MRQFTERMEHACIHYLDFLNFCLICSVKINVNMLFMFYSKCLLLLCITLLQSWKQADGSNLGPEELSGGVESTSQV